jgi:hypothetical protein
MDKGYIGKPFPQISVIAAEDNDLHVSSPSRQVMEPYLQDSVVPCIPKPKAPG